MRPPHRSSWVTPGERLTQAVRSGRGAAAANALCGACVQVLAVDAVAVSMVFDGLNYGTLGSSGTDAAAWDELQFTVGEGPCLDAVARRRPVLVAELDDSADTRWPAFRAALLDDGVHAVFAFPVVVAGSHVAALTLFRRTPGELSSDELIDSATAAELAAVPVLDLAAADWRRGTDPQEPGWDELGSLTRVEVAQATGMLMGQLDVDPVQALARLRAHAYATGRSATDVARDIVERVLVLRPDPPLR